MTVYLFCLSVCHLTLHKSEAADSRSSWTFNLTRHFQLEHSHAHPRADPRTRSHADRCAATSTVFSLAHQQAKTPWRTRATPISPSTKTSKLRQTHHRHQSRSTAFSIRTQRSQTPWPTQKKPVSPSTKVSKPTQTSLRYQSTVQMPRSTRLQLWLPVYRQTSSSISSSRRYRGSLESRSDGSQRRGRPQWNR